MEPISIVKSVIPFLKMLETEPRRPLVLVFVCMLAASLSEGFGIALLVPLIETLQGETATGVGERFENSFLALGLPFQPANVLALFMLMQTCKIVLQNHREILSSKLQYDLVDRLRKRSFMAVLRSEWHWLSQRNNAEYANLLLTDINRIGVGTHFFLQLCSGLTLLLAYTLAALWLSWPITLIVLAIGLLFVVGENSLRREALLLGNLIGQTSHSLHGVIQESLSGVKLAKILGNEEGHLQKFQQSIQAFRRYQLDFQRNSARSRARMQFGSMLILTILLYAGLVVWRLPIAELATLIFVFSRLMPQGGQLQQQVRHWLHSLPALENTNRLLAECQNAAEASSTTALRALPLKKELTLTSVNFRYPGREHAALNAVSLNLPAKSTTAIIGTSGAGKSTLADVLMGLLRPDTGSIAVDGESLDDLGRLRWRKSVAYVPQETILFNDSIRSNLLWAMPEARDEELWQALDKAAADFVQRLPEGLDTVVGDQGLRLSGGERQRIALARALLGKPSLLILDEATSALDMENEERIRQAIVNLHGDLTVVAIGHRMATLKHADQVLVMEAGAVIAQGCWNDIQNRRSSENLYAV